MAKSGLTKYTPNGAGARQIARSPEVGAILHAKGLQVVAAARSRVDGLVSPDWEITADTRAGKNRQRCIVSGVPMSVEAEHHIMSSALDAAGG